ncbi:hypothetical protein DYH09_19200 [bacterium CPR1]|nr:hypothetical protein [bacterium CPR1]
MKWLNLALSLLALGVGIAAWQRSSPAETAWLKGTPGQQVAQLEKHARGLDVAMAEIGYRYGELLRAQGQEQDELARYHLDKIRLALFLAVERRPKRHASARPFLEQAVPEADQALKSGDRVRIAGAMENLHQACLSCHAAEKVDHFIPVVERIRREHGH